MLRHHRDDANMTVRQYHLWQWPHSLASLYMAATDAEMDLGLLTDLVRAWDASATPPDDAVVVHVRVGDVLEYCHWTTCEPALTVQDLLTLNVMVRTRGCGEGCPGCQLTSTLALPTNLRACRLLCHLLVIST